MWQLYSKKSYRPGGSCIFKSKQMRFFSLVVYKICFKLQFVKPGLISSVLTKI